MLSKKAVVCLSEMHVMERRGQVGVGGEKSPMVHARIGEGRNTFRVSGKAAMRTTATGGGISWVLRGQGRGMYRDPHRERNVVHWKLSGELQ